MKSFKISLSWIMVCALGILIMGLSPASIAADTQDTETTGLKIGDVPPDFTIMDMQGNEFKLSEMVGESPIVIDFWATWCGWCVKEFPLMQKLTDKYGDRVKVYCITSEAEEAKPDIEKFIADNGYTMNFIHDPSKAIAKSYGVKGIPHTFVVGINGKLVGDHLGYSDDVVNKIVRELKLNKRQHGRRH